MNHRGTSTNPIFFKTPSKESIALSAQLECILDAFLSPPKHFQLMDILHVTSALEGD
jgi:hypothetical protein